MGKGRCRDPLPEVRLVQEWLVASGCEGGRPGACLDRELWPWNSHHAWGGVQSRSIGNRMRDLVQGSRLVQWAQAGSYPSHLLISAATQDRADLSEDRSLTFPEAGSPWAHTVQPCSLSRNQPRHHLPQSQPEQGSGIGILGLMFSYWPISKT